MDLKVLGIIGSLGTVVAGGGTYLALRGSHNSTSISELFKKEKGLKLIVEDSDSKWNEAWQKYKEDNRNKEIDKWRISNWKSKRDENEAFAEFKKECEKRSKLGVENIHQQEYKDIKRYCSRPKKVSELLSEEGTKILLNKGDDEASWASAWNKYKQDHIASSSGNTVTYESSNKWGFTGWSASSAVSSIPTNYKDTCEGKWNSHIDPERLTEDETFKQVKSWCTK